MVMTYRSALVWGNSTLKEHGIDSSIDARVLLCHAAGIDSLKLALCMSDEIEKSVYSKFCEFIYRRMRHEPVSYITGEREFMELVFKVQKGVLIPRPETEHTVEYIISLFHGKKAHILDMCTGSGAIAISLAKYLPDSTITAVDISEIAIETASSNAAFHNVSDRVNIVCSDALLIRKCDKKYDVIVSNPPYIPNEVVKSLEADVRDFEPHTALCGGDDGLVFYRAITKNAPYMLKKGGLLVYEVGHDQSEQVSDIMKQSFENIGFEKDLAGINRVVHGTLKEEN